MNGRKTPRDMGLGAVHTVTLAEARDKARDARKLILGGVDPIGAKRALKQARALEAASTLVFKECAEKYISAHKAGWRNAKHAGQWTSTLETYAYPLCVPKSRFSWELGKTRMRRPTQPILWGDAEGPTDDLFCISERL